MPNLTSTLDLEHQRPDDQQAIEDLARLVHGEWTRYHPDAPAAEFESLGEAERRAWEKAARRLCEEYLVADYNVHIEPREASDE